MPWLNRWEAERLVGRKYWAIHQWHKKGWVKAGKRDGRIVYDQTTLLIAAKRAQEARETHRNVAGPGRGKKGNYCSKSSIEKAGLPTLF